MANTENITYDKMICIVDYPEEIENIILNVKDSNTKMKNEKLIFVTPYLHLIEYLSHNNGFKFKDIDDNILKIKYLPPINPIPCYRLGFSNYNYNSTKIQKDGWLKIYVFISSWEKSVKGLMEYNAILEDIKNITKLKLKLYIQLDSPETIKYVENLSNIIQISDEVEYVYKKRYDEFLNIISNVDICLVRGNQYLPTAGIYDIISLGKPMIYVTENRNGLLFRNPLFEYEEELFFMGEMRENIKKMIINFLNDSSISYNKFRNAMTDSNFKNWKIYAKNIFNNQENHMRKFSIVTLVNKDDIYQKNVILSTYENKDSIEYITVKNSISGASGLNNGLKKVTNDIIICCHQDVYFKEGWYNKLNECIDKLNNSINYKNWGVLGFAGTTDNGKMVGTHSGLEMFNDEDIIPVQTLDESVLILKKDNSFKFDENLIYYHMYGTDISLQSYVKDLGVYVINVPIDHRTKWTSGNGFIESTTYIRNKWYGLYEVIHTTVGDIS